MFVWICKWFNCGFYAAKRFNQTTGEQTRFRFFPKINTLQNFALSRRTFKDLWTKGYFEALNQIFLFLCQVPFRIEHPPTGEVLYLEIFFNNHPYVYYRLRRCLIEDLATTNQFYRDTFTVDQFQFRIPVKDWLDAPVLMLQQGNFYDMRGGYEFVYSM